MASQSPFPLFPYTPSRPLAIVAVVLYCFLVVLHAFRMLRTRTWDNIFMVLGGIAQAAGHGARIVSSGDIYNKAAYDAQTVMLTLGPSLLMFTVNLTQSPFQRVLKAENLGLTPFRWQRTIFTSVNAAAFIVQMVGLSLQVSATSRPAAKTATQVIIASFIVQIFWWLFIMAEGIVIQLKFARRPQEDVKTVLPNWKRWNQLFGLATMIIFGRNLMRLTEFGMGATGFLMVNEWPGYAFDGYQMIVVMGAWGIFYLPGKCKQATKTAGTSWLEMNDGLAPHGSTEVVYPK